MSSGAREPGADALADKQQAHFVKESNRIANTVTAADIQAAHTLAGMGQGGRKMRQHRRKSSRKMRQHRRKSLRTRRGRSH
jgi:CelD/BcsL family acetyltransferase involved in cellulose biosynthesis